MRYCSELISKIIAEEMEKILAAFEVIGEAFSTAFDIGLLGWAEACEARALEITREALENMPDTWIAQQYLEKWDGKLPQLITGDGSGLMLTPNLE